MAAFKADVHTEIEAAFKNRQIKREVMDLEKASPVCHGLATRVSTFHDKRLVDIALRDIERVII